MADLYGTTLAANAGKVTTGVNLQGAALKFYSIDFGVDIRQADAAREVTWLTYTLLSQLGWTPVHIGTIQADGGGNAGQLLRFAVEVSGGEVMAVDTAANHGWVWSASVADPTVNYIDPSAGTTQLSAALSVALTDMFDNYTAFDYVDDAGAAQQIDLSNAVVSVFNF